MIGPRLIHPSQVYLAQVDRTADFDDVFGRPEGGLTYYPSVLLCGQVAYNDQTRRQETQAGELLVGDGYVLFYRADVLGLAHQLRPGDKIVGIDGATVDYEVLAVTDETVYDRPYWSRVDFRKVWDAR